MKFGIYCNNFTDTNTRAIEDILQNLRSRSIDVCFNIELQSTLNNESEFYSNHDELKAKADILITVGGDGTILSAAQYVYGSNIPIVGVNTGRLGYLTSVNPEEFSQSLDKINNNQFQIEKRSLLEIETNEESNNFKNRALNEISVLKKDSSSMITIHAKINGEFLNTYWADGLIISTATGSTAYSLSCGGPIMTPGSGNFIITPIAPHNLNVRPLVIPDECEIELTFESRSEDLLMALDSDSRIISEGTSIKIKLAPESIGLLRSNDYSYLETLRSKLNWGLDKRN